MKKFIMNNELLVVFVRRRFKLSHEKCPWYLFFFSLTFITNYSLDINFYLIINIFYLLGFVKDSVEPSQQMLQLLLI